MPNTKTKTPTEAQMLQQGMEYFVFTLPGGIKSTVMHHDFAAAKAIAIEGWRRAQKPDRRRQNKYLRAKALLAECREAHRQEQEAYYQRTGLSQMNQLDFWQLEEIHENISKHSH